MENSSARFTVRRPPERARLEEATQRAGLKWELTLPRTWLAVLTGVGVSGYFREFSLPCCVIPESDHNLWRTIWSTDRSVVALEILHGAQQGRTEYNRACLAKVAATRRPLVASHGGFYDLFVPVLEGKTLVGYLANGPFSRRVLSARDISERWAQMTGRPALSRDPDLLRYAAVALDTPVLNGKALTAHKRYMVELGKALSATEDFAVIQRRHRRYTQQMSRGRQFSGMWELARGLTDPAAHGFWSADFRTFQRDILGMSRLPNVVIAMARRSEQDEDPLQALVASRQFAEQCSEAAVGFTDTICGRAGATTAYLLTRVDPALPARRARQTIQRVLERVRAKLGRTAGTQTRFGVSQTVDPRALPRCLDEAIIALEWANHEGRQYAFYGDEAPRQAEARPMLFGSLSDIVLALRGGTGAVAVPIAVERLMREVAWRSASSVAAARAYVETLYAELAHVVRDSGQLEPRVIADRVAAFHAAIDEATSVRATTSAFQQHVAILHDALRHPQGAEREAKLSRAVSYVEAHIDRKLTLPEVARVAGYAPDYFSRLFRDLYGQTFEGWLLSLRLARAKQLLSTTELGIGQVGSACGFGSTAYFYRAFRRALGMTPAQFREARPNLLDLRTEHPRPRIKS